LCHAKEYAEITEPPKLAALEDMLVARSDVKYAISSSYIKEMCVHAAATGYAQSLEVKGTNRKFMLFQV
jgi:hypothetical protein